MTTSVNNVVAGLQDNLKAVGKFVTQDFPGGVLAFTATCLTSVVTIKLVYGKYQLSKTKRKIQKRQAKSRQNIQNVKQRLSQMKFDASITSLPFRELQAKLQSGELEAVQVLRAFQAKALEAHENLNCITEFIEDAEQRAAVLDTISPEDRGPLHGIPVSLKESVGVSGSDCTTGMSMFIDQIRTEDGVIHKMLLKQGAVPFVRTNLSQCQMSANCYNPIYGVTRNPHNKNRTSGGSSGGEAAIIGAGASILGVGCDMAGSNRIPSHFCGVVGVRVTPTRISNSGNFNIGPWVKIIEEVYSPMGRDVDAVLEFLRATVQPEQYTLDPRLPPVPWRDELYQSTQPLRIGFYTKIGDVEPMPAVTRAVMMTKKNLEKQGHTVIEFCPPDVLSACENLFISAVMGDNGDQVRDLLKHDFVDPGTKALVTLYGLPYFVRKLVGKFFASTQLERCNITAKTPSKIYEWWDKTEEKDTYIRKFISQMKEQGLDALICPPFPFPAWPVDDEDMASFCLVYTALYNILDFPCGVVPATNVQGKDLEDMKNYPSKTSIDRYIQRICKGCEGMPIGVQCVGLPFQEEVLLRLMKEVEKGFKS